MTTPLKKPDKPKTGTLNIKLSQRDGWNFGLGFFAAAFVFTFIIVPTIGCLAIIIISLYGGLLLQ